MSSNERKALVEKIREEGEIAFLEGKHIQSNPYKYMDAYQWSEGYELAREAFERKAQEK